MPAHYFDKVRIALGGPNGDHMADEPEKKARDPEPQTDAEGGSERSIEDRDGPRRAPHEDRLCQRAMDWRHEAWDLAVHQISTPPPKEKNDRKKLDAANAIDRPNTI